MNRSMEKNKQNYLHVHLAKRHAMRACSATWASALLESWKNNG